MPLRPLSTELCFPALPPGAQAKSADGSPGDAVATDSFLRIVGNWRRAVLAWIAPPNQKEHRDLDGLTERACQALATFLEAEWPPGMKEYAQQSPYNIAEFPLRALDSHGAAPSEAVLDILRWRAAVMDYLGDVWDVMGEPFLTLDECDAMQAFLRPPESRSLCHLCLRPFLEAERHPDGHRCEVLGHVRAKWSAPPPAFVRWAEEARTSSSPGEPQRTQPTKPATVGTTPRRRWWQFWK